MKKVWIILLAALLLVGCKGPVEYETLADVYLEPELPEPKRLTVLLPADATALTMESDSGSLYLCDSYSVMLQTLSAGDLDATLRSVTGYSREQLPVMETEFEGLRRYECVWVSAGECGDQVGRTVVLDDGNYHYTLSLLADAEEAGALTNTWQDIIASASLNIDP